MLRLLFLVLCSSTMISPHAVAGIVISIDDWDVMRGTTSFRIPVFVSGPDMLNGISLAFGLGDGGPAVGGTETATITGFSLDQTIWDTNPLVGFVSTPGLGTPSPTPLLPSGATVLNLPGASSTSFVNPNGVLVFFTADFSAKPVGSSVRLDPNILNFTVANSTNAAPISLSFRSGMASVTAVPEPGSIGLLIGALAGVTILRTRHFFRSKRLAMRP